MPNVNKAIRNIDGMIADFEKLSKQIELFAANRAKAIILVRIFTEGKASDGTDIGQYDDKKKQTFLTNRTSFTQKQQKKVDKVEGGLTYKELRALKGLRVDKVDLQFTGQLFESIEVVEKGDRFIVGITSKDRAKIAEYLEKKYGKDIFIIKGEEKENLIKEVTLFATKKFSEITQKWSQR